MLGGRCVALASSFALATVLARSVGAQDDPFAKMGAGDDVVVLADGTALRGKLLESESSMIT